MLMVGAFVAKNSRNFVAAFSSALAKGSALPIASANFADACYDGAVPLLLSTPATVATTQRRNTPEKAVHLNRGAALITDAAVPESIVHYVMRTRDGCVDFKIGLRNLGAPRSTTKVR